jgi:SGT1 protein
MDSPKDGLKWFGEGFDGFPKRLPEDCVEYMLFIINTKLKQRELLSRLEEVRQEALELTKELLKDYIWQRDDFKLNSETHSETGRVLVSSELTASYYVRRTKIPSWLY